MNSQTRSHPFVRCTRIIAALYAGVFLISAAPAQPVTGMVHSRYLLIFDTSSAMKKRVPAAQDAVERLFFSMMNGQLRPGDTIGVWAFDRKLRAGEFPLQHWMPQNAAVVASDITNFVRLQRYSRSTRLDVVMPDVNNLVRNSERLTVLIFCDGDGEINGMPYDNAINAIFKQNRKALEQQNQVFIIVLRSQLGQYTGYTVNSSAIGVNFPEFPPLPAPSQPTPPSKTRPPPVKAESNPPPVVQLPPLVIIGTNVETHLLPSESPTAELTNPPPAKAESNSPPAESAASSTNTSPTNAALSKMAQTHTNAVVPTGENTGLSRGGALAIGAVLLVAAVLLIFFALIRSRKTGRGSLITRSMKKD